MSISQVWTKYKNRMATVGAIALAPETAYAKTFDGKSVSSLFISLALIPPYIIAGMVAKIVAVLAAIVLTIALPFQAIGQALSSLFSKSEPKAGPVGDVVAGDNAQNDDVASDSSENDDVASDSSQNDDVANSGEAQGQFYDPLFTSNTIVEGYASAEESNDELDEDAADYQVVANLQ